MKVIKCVDKKNGCKKCDLKEKELDEVVGVLKSGELVIVPTDTLYGVAADPFNEASIKKVFVAKNRPFDMPLCIAVSNEKMMESVAVLNDPARRLIRKFFPGPLTIMLTGILVMSDAIVGSRKAGLTAVADQVTAPSLINRLTVGIVPPFREFCPKPSRTNRITCSVGATEAET